MKRKANKPIDSYAHTDAERANNPPVGLVSAGTDPDDGPRRYRHRLTPPPGDENPGVEHGADGVGFGDGEGDPGEGSVGERDPEGGEPDGGSVAQGDPGEGGFAHGGPGEGGSAEVGGSGDRYVAPVGVDPHLEPELIWASKAVRGDFVVPTVSLHVHERIDPRTIIEAVRRTDGDPVGGSGQGSLFEQPEENPPLRQAIEFYRHAHNWSNRLIAGDSLLVMNSLLAKENLGGKVGMVYVDPPYGIKYGSNFQPFTNKREVTDGKATHLSREPETIRAFRDTWELGIHSYLSYMRDRLLLARKLLAESGSCFVQIGNENVHRMALLCDEVFGAENRMATITYATSGSSSSKTLPEVGDYLLWYARDKERVKYRQLYEQLDRAGIVKLFSWHAAVELEDGSTRKLTLEERFDSDGHLPEGARLFRATPLQSQGWSRTGRSESFEWQDRTYDCPDTLQWRVSMEGLDRLAELNRLFSYTQAALWWKWYEDEVPGRRINNIWHRKMSPSDKRYVVQTARSVIQRCLLMTTDPGDLVFDPTCGSGTTAFVAEQWGRRWITCDTSRVALALARQRLMTATFDYYTLAHPGEGVGGGFVYRTVPKVSAASLAYDEPPQLTTVYDQPERDRGKHRVTGPFTIEAVPAPTVLGLDAPLDTDDHPAHGSAKPASTVLGLDAPLSIDDHPAHGSAKSAPTVLGLDAPLSIDDHSTAEPAETAAPAHPAPADNSIAREGETARHHEWINELANAGIRGKGRQRIAFTRLEPLACTRLHAVGEATSVDWEAPRRVVVAFGPEFAPLEQRRVEHAIEEATMLVPRPELVVFAAFAFDPEAAKDIDEINWPGITLVRAAMNTDLQTDDLTKARTANESFWLVGQPEVVVSDLADGRYEVEVLGFDYFDIDSGEHISGDAGDIAVWLLDTDYDGRSLFPRQVFFPSDGAKGGWSKLAKTLKAGIDAEAMAAYSGTVSLPFEAGDNRRAAVKITDNRGIESLAVVDLR